MSSNRCSKQCAPLDFLGYDSLSGEEFGLERYECLALENRCRGFNTFKQNLYNPCYVGHMLSISEVVVSSKIGTSTTIGNLEARSRLEMVYIRKNRFFPHLVIHGREGARYP